MPNIFQSIGQSNAFDTITKAIDTLSGLKQADEKAKFMQKEMAVRERGMELDEKRFGLEEQLHPLRMESQQTQIAVNKETLAKAKMENEEAAREHKRRKTPAKYSSYTQNPAIHSYIGALGAEWLDEDFKAGGYENTTGGQEDHLLAVAKDKFKAQKITGFIEANGAERLTSIGLEVEKAQKEYDKPQHNPDIKQKNYEALKAAKANQDRVRAEVAAASAFGMNLVNKAIMHESVQESAKAIKLIKDPVERKRAETRFQTALADPAVIAAMREPGATVKDFNLAWTNANRDAGRELAQQVQILADAEKQRKKIEYDKWALQFRQGLNKSVAEAKDLSQAWGMVKEIDSKILAYQQQIFSGIDPEGRNTYALTQLQTARQSLITKHPKLHEIFAVNKEKETAAYTVNMDQAFARMYQDWKSVPKGSPEEKRLEIGIRSLYTEKLADGTIPPTMHFHTWWESQVQKNTQAPYEEGVGSAGYL